LWAVFSDLNAQTSYCDRQGLPVCFIDLLRVCQIARTL
jgi:hypothetical protein